MRLLTSAVLLLFILTVSARRGRGGGGGGDDDLTSPTWIFIWVLVGLTGLVALVCCWKSIFEQVNRDIVRGQINQQIQTALAEEELNPPPPPPQEPDRAYYPPPSEQQYYPPPPMGQVIDPSTFYTVRVGGVDYNPYGPGTVMAPSYRY